MRSLVESGDSQDSNLILYGIPANPLHYSTNPLNLLFRYPRNFFFNMQKRSRASSPCLGKSFLSFSQGTVQTRDAGSLSGLYGVTFLWAFFLGWSLGAS